MVFSLKRKQFNCAIVVFTINFCLLSHSYSNKDIDVLGLPDVKLSHATREGDHVVLKCSGYTTSVHRKIFWEVSKPNRKSDKWRYISSCDVIRGCKDVRPEKTTTSMKSPKSTIHNLFTVTLKLHSAGPRRREDKFRCSARDYSSNITSIFEVYRLNLFSMPPRPKCTVVDVTNRTRQVKEVTVKCGPMNVFPRLKCKMQQRWNYVQSRFHIKPEITFKDVKFQYAHDDLEVNGNKYRNESCTALFQLSFPGHYSFSFQVLPQVSYLKGRDHKFRWTKFSKTRSVSVERVQNLASVKILRETRHYKFCPNKNGQHVFTCLIFGRKEDYSYVYWFVNGTLQPESSVKNKYKPNEFLLISKLSVHTFPDRQTVTCVVKEPDSNRAINDTITPKLRVPKTKTPSLIFVNDRGQEIGSNASVLMGESVKFTCTTKETNRTPISSLYIVCQRSRNSVQIEVKDVSKGKQLYITTSSDINGTQCMCYAKWKKLCYNTSASFSLAVFEGLSDVYNVSENYFNNQKDSHLVSKDNAKHTTTTIFSLTIPTLLVMIAVISISYCIWKRKARQHPRSIDDVTNITNPTNHINSYETIASRRSEGGHFDPYHISDQELRDAEERLLARHASMDDASFHSERGSWRGNGRNVRSVSEPLIASYSVSDRELGDRSRLITPPSDLSQTLLKQIYASHQSERQGFELMNLVQSPSR